MPLTDTVADAWRIEVWTAWWSPLSGVITATTVYIQLVLVVNYKEN